jgi:hypothetical protein
MSGMHKHDLLGECNADHHPIERFTRECCADCFNPECTRSLSGKTKFDHRVSNWFERFFGDQDRMDSGDPRFPRISAQKFIMIDPGLTGRTPEVGGGSAWLDPRQVEEPPPRTDLAKVPPTRTVEPELPASIPVRRSVPQQLLLANVPVQSHQLIQAPPSANSAPSPKDPWSGPVPEPKVEETIVQPGARVKMGV